MARNHFKRSRVCSSDNYELSKRIHVQYIKEEHCKNVTYIEKFVETNYVKAAMSQLNIIRKALNLGQDLHLTKDPKDSYIYCPYNVFITKDSIYYKAEINSGKFEIIGKIKNEGKEYFVLGNYAYSNSYPGLGSFIPHHGVSTSEGNYNGFLGCATKEIAQHFSKYFGILITEAKYGDMVDLEIVERKYQ